MNRRPSTQDLTWLLDLNNNKQLNLDPPYQRRSVWTLKDKQFFLDTIFRNYPSPAIFLHKSLNENGKATYHVVDGKQRIQTILDFVAGKIKLSKDFGDVRLGSKRWLDLVGDTDLKQALWNYQITVEQIDVDDGAIVNEVFDRLNRNSRRLTAQELRHAKFEGWLITQAEVEATREEWGTLGVVTKARAKRMNDCQFISELMLVLLEGKIIGFDQDVLDEFYGKYDDIAETVPELNEDDFISRLEQVKSFLLSMEETNKAITQFAKGLGNFYSLWSLVALGQKLPDAATLASRFVEFMQRVDTLTEQSDLTAFLLENSDTEFNLALTYLNNSRGASTDLSQRTERLGALRKALAVD